MTMKNTINRMNKITAEQSKKNADFESILFAGERKYKNSMVEATSAEVYALRYALEDMHERVNNQTEVIIDLIKYIERLENKVDTLEMKAIRTGAIRVERTIHETVDVHYTGEPTKAKSNRMNIDWRHSPVDTAFELFDEYCRDNHHLTAITPAIVKENWSTLFTTCKPKTGMTLGRLLKEYAKQRGLNY